MLLQHPGRRNRENVDVDARKSTPVSPVACGENGSLGLIN
jgi:hypothetical protein